jgi:hypothetical protein
MVLPGARQMQHVRRLVESRPYLARVPDPSLILAGQGEGTHRIQAARGSDGSYAFLYAASGNPVTVDLEKVSGATVRAWWFDPRTGEAEAIGEFAGGRPREFTPPSSGKGCDWVLALDDAARKFPPPGQVR